MSPRPRPRPRSIPSLYSLSGTSASSLSSIIQTPSNISVSTSGSPSPSPSPSPFSTLTPTPSQTSTPPPGPPPPEFIFPIPLSGLPSSTTPLLLIHHPSRKQLCTCKYPPHRTSTSVAQNPSSTHPSPTIHFRNYSIQRSTLLNLQITSGVLLIFSLAIIILSPFTNHSEDGTSTLGRERDDDSSLTSLHNFENLNHTTPTIQTHKLLTPPTQRH
ncbi:hypothetical protein EAE96_003640 [Botrytis aclada]|nr:hypothetical protein EAE96_003640 [Botrytis aclada]